MALGFSAEFDTFSPIIPVSLKGKMGFVSYQGRDSYISLFEVISGSSFCNEIGEIEF